MSHVAQNCIVAMILGLRQAFTRIGCLQAFELGPTVKEPCPAEMADYDRVYYDSVTGASLLSGLTPIGPIGTRWVFTNKDDTEHPFIWARLVAQETKRTTNMDLTDTSMTFAATPPVEGFRFLLQGR